jgi:hypothetical protein
MAAAEPRYEIRTCEVGPFKGGPYFVLIDSLGNIKYESNVYQGGAVEDQEEFCKDGAERQLEMMIASEKIE